MGSVADYSGSGNARNRLYLAQDFLFHPNHALRFRDLRFGNRNAQRLQLLRAGEAGIDVPQGLEGADHQSGTDQQDNSQRHLHDHQKTARAMPLLALAERAAPAAAARSIAAAAHT